MKKVINPEGIWKPEVSKGWVFSQGMEARGKRMIFVSGQGAFTPDGKVRAKGDVGSQTEFAIKSIRKILREAGADLEDVVKVTVYLRRVEDRPIVAEVRKKYFKGDFPASSLVGVELADKDMLVEIEAIAVCD